MSIFSSNAARYHEAGFQVVPVWGKVSRIKGWSFWSKVAQTDEDVEHMVSSSTGSTGIGLIMGFKVWALDIDSDNKELLDALPDSPMIKRGRIGQTRFYRCTGGGLPEFNRKHKLRPVEALGVGAQTVVPPSIHPVTGDAYQWVRCDEISLDALPELDPKTVYDQMVALCERSRITREGMSDDVERERPEMRPSTAPAGVGSRNSYLQEVAYAMCCDRLIDKKTIEELALELLEEDRRKFGKDSWFDDAKEYPYGSTALSRSLHFVTRADNAAVRNGDQLAAWSFTLASVNAELDAQNEIELVAAEARELESKDVYMATGLFKAPSAMEYQRILDYSKFMASLSEFMKVTEPSYSPAMTLGMALAAQAAASAGIVQFNKMRGNLFICNIAPPSFGKASPQRVLKRLLLEAGKDYVGDKFIKGRYDSSKGVLVGLRTNAKRLRVDIQDEVGTLFGAMAATGGGGQRSPHAGILDTMCELFSASNDLMLESLMNDQNKKTEQTANPHVVWMGSTTPAGLEALFTNEGVWSKGFGARSLFLIEDRKKGTVGKMMPYLKFHDAAGSELVPFSPQTLSPLRAAFAMPAPMAATSGNVDLMSNPWAVSLNPERIWIEDEAVDKVNELFNVYYDAADALREVQNDENDPIAGVLGRRAELVAKILIGHYVGLGMSRAITVADVDWADQIMALSQGSLVQYVKKFNNQMSYEDKLLTKVKQSVGIGTNTRLDNFKRSVKRAHTVVTRGRGKPMTTTDVNLLIRDWVESGEIHVDNKIVRT